MCCGGQKRTTKGGGGKNNRQKQGATRIPSPGVSLNARLTNPSTGPVFDAVVVLTASEQLPKSSVKTMQSKKRTVLRLAQRGTGSGRCWQVWQGRQRDMKDKRERKRERASKNRMINRSARAVSLGLERKIQQCRKIKSLRCEASGHSSWRLSIFEGSEWNENKGDRKIAMDREEGGKTDSDAPFSYLIHQRLKMRFSLTHSLICIINFITCIT